MNIYHEKPSDWIDLQNKVAHVLEICGFNVETPKVLESVRGNVEVDVYAKSLDMLIICECKYWKSNIPQNIIFAFRTILSDIGANKGIVIAKNGFQVGAYKQVEKTNIEIVTWEEFIEQYKEKYLKLYVKKLSKIERSLYRLAVCKNEYLKYYDILDKVHRLEINQLLDKLRIISINIGQLSIMLQYEEDPEIGWNIEYLDNIIFKISTSFDVEFSSYSGFFE